MKNIMVFKGVSNVDMGVVLTSKPTISTPIERGEALEIPGRSGDIWRGEGAYLPITINVPIHVLPWADFMAVRTWLIGAGELQFDSDATYWEARINGETHYAPRDFDGGYDTTLSFLAQPFRRIRSNDIVLSSNPQSIINPSAVFAEPLVRVECYGSFNLIVNNNICSLSGVTGLVQLDSALQEAYVGRELVNSRMTGPFPILQPGQNDISYSGAVSSVTIVPRWRVL